MIEPHPCKFGDIQLGAVKAMIRMYKTVNILDYDFQKKLCIPSKNPREGSPLH